MSRLDSFIRRMQAQRACIDAVAEQLQGIDGPVLEVGLGNGRSYDHLRERFPGREIYVFDRDVRAHPDCVPEASYLRLGDFRASLPAFAQEGLPLAAFIHADIGSGGKEASVHLTAELAPTLLRLLAPGAFLVCDQPLVLAGLRSVPLPEGVSEGRYHIFQRAA